MPKSRLFDNIMQNIQVRNTIASTTTVSSEIDLELPRGYVAKIHKVIVFAYDIWDLIVNTEKDLIEFALLLDPDDTETTAIPENTVEHDVLVDGTIEYGINTTLGNSFVENYRTEWDFSHLEGLDILSARNMRFNIVGAADYVDGAEVRCEIFYTLEPIKDNQIMELLDIL